MWDKVVDINWRVRWVSTNIVGDKGNICDSLLPAEMFDSSPLLLGAIALGMRA